MKKKILAICITGMFIIVGVTGVTSQSIKKTDSIEHNNDVLKEVLPYGSARVTVSGSCSAYADCYVETNEFYNSGDYEGSVEVHLNTPGDARRYVGVYQVIVTGPGPHINEYGSFDYEWLENPDDIHITDIGYIPPGRHLVEIYASVTYNVWFWDYDEGVWVSGYTEECKDEFTGLVTFPRSNPNFKTPFLNFLRQHPNMFPILRLLLQRLGLQLE